MVATATSMSKNDGIVRQFELIDQVVEYEPEADETSLNKAYVFAMKAHGGQTRKNGDPYFTHPVAVASILTEYRLDCPTIVSALLHDVVEDTEITLKEIKKEFGEKVANIVDGVTKLSKAESQITGNDRQSESFRKLLVALAQDPRVLFIKLADRLHNMRTIRFMDPASGRRIAQETLDIYAPLSGRIGIQAIRDELEDLSFRTLNPAAATAITRQLEQLVAGSSIVDDTILQIEDALKNQHLPAQVFGRRKAPYSIWRKIQQREVQLERLADIFGFRVITDTVENCYRVFCAIHSLWNYVPSTFKDYISAPKANGYQSLHTKVIGPGNQRIEIQIRTKEMHNVAEYGLAAHSEYKVEKYSSVSTDSKNSDTESAVQNNSSDISDKFNHDLTEDKYLSSSVYQGLRNMVEDLAEGNPAKEVLEDVKLELFVDQIFVFTPGGRMICLPKGATVIDFAYAVHTDLGNCCTGCKVNGRLVSVGQKLKSGDEIEIITSKGIIPPLAWIDIAVTGRARSAIRRAHRRDVADSMRAVGARILGQALHIAKQDGLLDRDFDLSLRIKKLNNGTTDEVYEKIGRGDITTQQVLGLDNLGKTARPWWRSATLGWLSRSQKSKTKTNRSTSSLILVGGNVSGGIKMSSVAGAVPGDEIVGVRQENGTIEVYHAKSNALRSALSQSIKQNDGKRSILRQLDLAWVTNIAESTRFIAQFKIELRNEPGSLANVLSCFAKEEINVADLKLTLREPKIFRAEIEAEVKNADETRVMVEKIRDLPNVTRAYRDVG